MVSGRRKMENDKNIKIEKKNSDSEWEVSE